MLGLSAYLSKSGPEKSLLELVDFRTEAGGYQPGAWRAAA